MIDRLKEAWNTLGWLHFGDPDSAWQDGWHSRTLCGIELDNHRAGRRIIGRFTPTCPRCKRIADKERRHV